MPSVDLENSAAQCFDVRLDAPKVLKNRYAAIAHISLKRELWNCGCTSRLIAYSVNKTGTDQPFVHERFALRGDVRRQLDLGRRSSMQEDARLKLRIGCAGA